MVQKNGKMPQFLDALFGKGSERDIGRSSAACDQVMESLLYTPPPVQETPLHSKRGGGAREPSLGVCSLGSVEEPSRGGVSCTRVGGRLLLSGQNTPPPRGWVGVGMGGWVGPKFQYFGPPGTLPPRGRGGAGALFLGFGLWRPLRPVNFSHIFHIFFIQRQTCEPFVAHYCQTSLVAELVMALDFRFKDPGSTPDRGKFLLVGPSSELQPMGASKSSACM